MKVHKTGTFLRFWEKGTIKQVTTILRFGRKVLQNRYYFTNLPDILRDVPTIKIFEKCMSTQVLFCDLWRMILQKR